MFVCFTHCSGELETPGVCEKHPQCIENAQILLETPRGVLKTGREVEPGPGREVVLFDTVN